MDTAEEESIESFLHRLKLSDAYLHSFLNNGYSIVKDCQGMTEETLKSIGVTLPGHFRRIMNHLSLALIEQNAPPLQDFQQSSERTVQSKIRAASMIGDITQPQQVFLDGLSRESNCENTVDEATYETLSSYTLPLPPKEMKLSSVSYERLLSLPPPPPEFLLEDEHCGARNLRETFQIDHISDFSGEDLAKTSGILLINQTKLNEEGHLETGLDLPSFESVEQDNPCGLLEDEYDHILRVDGHTQSQSTNNRSDDTAIKFSAQKSETAEGEYDRLNSKTMSAYHKRLSRESLPSYITAPDSAFHFRETSETSEFILDLVPGEHPVPALPGGLDDKSAKNMPLPPPPWKAVVEGKDEEKTRISPAIDSHSMDVEQDSFSTTPESVTSPHWQPNLGVSFQDTLSVGGSGQCSYNAKSPSGGARKGAEETEDGISCHYEIVECSDLITKITTPPSAPHNTPYRSLTEMLNDLKENEQDPSSYEEIEFLPRVAPPQEIGPYGSSDRNRSKTMTSQSSSEKGGKSAYRRLTGMQAHLQKAAKAAMKKHMPKRKGFAKISDWPLETAICHSDDNESLDSSPSRKGSMYESTENHTDIFGSGVGHPLDTKPRKEKANATVCPEANSPTTIAPERDIDCVSPLTCGKLSDIGQQTAFEVQDNTYEDIRNELSNSGHTTSGRTNIPPIARTRMKKSNENMARRPVSVFADSRLSGINPTSRGRTSSATLNRDVVGTLRPYSDEKDLNEYEDTGAITKKKSSNVSAVSPLAKKRTKSGWLWKHGGHDGRAPLRKRWVVFDGDELIYYESDSKKEFSKGVIPVDVMLRVQIPQNDSLIFHVQTKGGRKYIFQAENSDERAVWTSTLMAAIMMFENGQHHQFKPGGSMYMPYKEGHMKMDGIRQKVYFAIKGEYAAYYKNKSEFQFAQPVTRLQMKLATVKDVDKRKFQIVFPYRTFALTAESEEEKQSWIESLLEAIAEGLSDYQVLDEIWINEANQKCADCGRAYPDWSSINLAIVICKHCAGVHRDLGVQNSKVRSLKMDIKIWNPVMKRLLLDVGNDGANEFWANKLSASETINDMADKNQRAWFIKAKYIDMSYAKIRPQAGDQELINQSLIEAVRNDSLVETYRLAFSGADLNCFTGKEHAKTPLLLAKYLTYTTLAEFLRQNGGTEVISPAGHITERSASVRKRDHNILKPRVKPPLSLRDCLYKYGGDFKESVEDKGKGKLNLIISVLQPGDFQKRLCILENNTLKYCDPEKPNVIKDYISCHDLISVTVHTPEQAVKAGYQYCFELSRASGRTYLFCASSLDALRRWTMGLLQSIVPPFIQDVMQPEEDYDRAGKMNIKAIRHSQSSMGWATTWCHLRKKNLQYFHNEAQTMELIDLRKLVQIVVDQSQEMTTTRHSGTQNKETIPVIMLVFRDKSYHLHSDTRPDTESWMNALRRSDNLIGKTLEEVQLTADGVPTILEKCITFVEQCGIRMRGIYRLCGTHSKTTQLLDEFRRNARETQMREGDINVHDVANALKRWFKSLPGSLLTEQLHDQWTETAQIKEEHHDTKLKWYKHLIEKLPEINKMTLKVLLQHLQNVSSYEQENEMSIHNIAIVFGPTLMEPVDEESGAKYIGHTSHEICCIEDLLRFYDWLFDVTETDRRKELMMQIAKAKIDTTQWQKNMLTTLDYDMMAPIYINRKQDKCVNYKVNLSADELVKKVCRTHGCPENWGLYEVILDGDVERPLHHTEHVLAVIKSWSMPSTNYLVVKNDIMRDRMRWHKQSVMHDLETIMEGTLRTFEGKKKWTKVTGSICRSDGTPYFKYAKNASEVSQLDNMTSASWRKRSVKTRGKGWNRLSNFNDAAAKNVIYLEIKSIKVYVGVDKKTKPPGNGRHGFTIISIGEKHPKYFIAENEEEMFRWAACMSLVMHPDGYTPPVTPVETLSNPYRYEQTVNSAASTKQSAYTSVSQQELGAAIAKVATELRRTPSNESCDDAQKTFQDKSLEATSSPGINVSQSSQALHSPKDIPENDPLLSAEQSEGGNIQNATHIQLHRHPGEATIRPNMLLVDTESSRPHSHYALSPGDPRHQPRAGLGIQLRDELSTVLRKRTQ